MSLPSNFWEEFDRRLDARFAASEKKINDKIDKVIKWTQRQDESIERELTMACLNHFQHAYPGYLPIVPSKNVIGRIIKDRNGLTITDFDGLIILTNDSKFGKYLKGKEDGNDKLSKSYKAYIIIVEAKQHVTAAKVRKKIEQREKLQNVLFESPLLTGFDEFIGFYIGGVDVDSGARTIIHQFIKDNEGREMVGTLELNGFRFTVQDLKNEHGKSSILYGGLKRVSLR